MDQSRVFFCLVCRLAMVDLDCERRRPEATRELPSPPPLLTLVDTQRHESWSPRAAETATKDQSHHRRCAGPALLIW